MIWWTLRKLKSTNSSTRVAAVAELATRADHPSVVEGLLAALRSWSDRDLRLAAAQAILKTNVALVAGQIESALLIEEDPQVCACEVAALARAGYFKSESSLQYTRVLLQKGRTFGSEDIRATADRALEELDTLQKQRAAVDGEQKKAAREREIDRLFQLMMAVDYGVREPAAKALARIGAPAVERLLQESNSDGVWGGYLTALRELRDPHAVNSLLAALQAGHRLGSWIADVLGEIGDTQAVPLLVSSLMKEPGSPPTCSSSSAAKALVKLGWTPETRAQEAQLAVWSGDYPRARRVGRIALPALLSLLEGHAKSNDSYKGDDVPNLIDAVSWIADHRSVDLLLRILFKGRMNENKGFRNNGYKEGPIAPKVAAAASNALCRVLGRSADGVPADVLRSVFEIGDAFTITYCWSDYDPDHEVSRERAIDFTRLREAAHQELARRLAPTRDYLTSENVRVVKEFWIGEGVSLHVALPSNQTKCLEVTFPVLDRWTASQIQSYCKDQNTAAHLERTPWKVTIDRDVSD